MLWLSVINQHVSLHCYSKQSYTLTNLVPKFFLWVLPLVGVIHCCKLSLYAISRETNEPNLKKKGKKPSLVPNFEAKFGPYFDLHLGPKKLFLRILPLKDIWHKCMLLLYAIWRKTNQPSLTKWLKTSSGLILTLWPKFGPPIFFL